MKRLKILIIHFPNLNNYGTGMMGIVTIQALATRFGVDNIEFYCDFNEFADIDEIKSELKDEDVILNRYVNVTQKKIEKIKNPIYRKIRKLLYLFCNFEGKGFDKMIFLGGDNLSECYSPYNVSFDMFNCWKASFKTKVILLGQTIGPFNHPLNRFTSKYLLPRLNVYARDPWSVEYLQNEFGVKIHQSADLALNDLPLQFNKIIEANVLNKYGLKKNEYITIVVSGLQKRNIYCGDFQTYISCFEEIIEMLLTKPQLNNMKICLLAHTFPPYDDEVSIIQTLDKLIPEKLKSCIILVADRILQTQARFILGNGLFTITGRMHAAVSTFQMGKPAICLSYSAKFKGVIGDSIGRSDLVIESNETIIWDNGSIVDAVNDKVTYLLDNYMEYLSQINKRVKIQKQLVIDSFKNI